MGNLLASAAFAVLAMILHPEATSTDLAYIPSEEPDSDKMDALDAHNQERIAFGVEPLTWSAQLEAEAQVWAEILASEGRMRHASNDERRGAGENLWMGPSDVFPVPVIIGTFIAEKQHFVPGEFPQVSSTGKWRDVGHYTQVIWPSTKELGCAVARNSTDEFWVCRYWPAGNNYGFEVRSTADRVTAD